MRKSPPILGRSSVELQRILDRVCSAYRIGPADVCGPGKLRHIAEARMVCMYLSRRLTEHSSLAITRYFGREDHATVLHACRAVKDLMDAYPYFQAEVESLAKAISESSGSPAVGG